MSEPMQAAGDLRTELVDGVLTLTLDRPHAPYAVSLTLVASLHAVLSEQHNLWLVRMSAGSPLRRASETL
jgi:enoyl-CoA hydratase/carnithine racemase